MSKRSLPFITVIMQIAAFSLDLSTSNKNFETTKYSLERSFQKKQGYPEKSVLKFLRKTLRSNLKSPKSKEKKLALTLFYYVSWEIWLGNSKKLLYINQSRFYIFSHPWEFKCLSLQDVLAFLTINPLQTESRRDFLSWKDLFKRNKDIQKNTAF